MKIIAILFAISAFTFLARVLVLAYEALCMDFEFDLPWHEDSKKSQPTAAAKIPDMIKKIDRVLTYQA